MAQNKQKLPGINNLSRLANDTIEIYPLLDITLLVAK
jgi:hypothetical protein